MLEIAAFENEVNFFKTAQLIGVQFQFRDFVIQNTIRE